MRISDIIRHLSKTLHNKTGLKVYNEDINSITRPCIYITSINSSREFKGQGVEKLTASFDIKYFPSQANTICNTEIQDALDTINGAFDKDAYKLLTVFDRTLIIDNISSSILDNTGHYMIDLEIFTSYGERIKYDLMRKLELDIENKN